MSILKAIKDFGRDAAVGAREVWFPMQCCHCDRRLPAGTRDLCIRCRSELVTLDLHQLPENIVTDLFWGRLPVERAACLLPYGGDAPVKRLMWRLKYDNRPDIGLRLGAWLGRLMDESDTFGDTDVIVPVPLHPRRLQKRGYNQAERIAAGIAESTGGLCLPHAVRRTRHTQTQTKKSRFERMANMDDVFELSRARSRGLQTPASLIHGKHVVLVDDVMTTGATLGALGRAVLKAQPASLKVATLALARK